MTWNEISIFTTSQGIEPVSGRLYQLGITGLMIIDKDEFNDFVKHNLRAWDMVDEELYERHQKVETCVKAYLPDIPESNETLSAIRESMAELRKMDEKGEYGRLDVVQNGLKEEDWQNGWKQYYKPLRIGNHVLIKPSWENAEPKEGDVVVELDPGMAFGTGTHETTHMCVLLLEQYLTGGQTVLDVGTGSGILAITCAKLGAEKVQGVDIDPLAVKIARENVAMNGLTDTIQVAEGDLVKVIHDRYDLVVANIIADIIKVLAPDVPSRLTENGLFLASGIVKEKYDMVKEAIQTAGMEIVDELEMNDWCAVVAKRK